MVPVGPSASPRSGPWSVGRWPAPNSARSFALERPPRFALGFPLARKPMTSVLFTLGRTNCISPPNVRSDFRYFGPRSRLFRPGPCAFARRGRRAKKFCASVIDLTQEE